MQYCYFFLPYYKLIFLKQLFLAEHNALFVFDWSKLRLFVCFSHKFNIYKNISKDLYIQSGVL